MSKLQMYVLILGMIGGALLAVSSGSLSRNDVLTPVLAVGLTAPLGWAGMDLLERLRTRLDPPSDRPDGDETY